jgi:membrane-associated phospholipid phosphatase
MTSVLRSIPLSADTSPVLCVAASIVVSLWCSVARAAEDDGLTDDSVGSSASVAAGAERRAPPPAHRLVWNAAWPRFGIIEYGSTIAAFEMLGFIEFRMTLPNGPPRWKGGILFDDAVRSAVRLHSRDGRLAAGNVADALALTAEIEPIFASVVPPLVDRWNFDVGWQMIAIDTESQAFAGLTQRTLMYIAQRARPSYDDCKKDPKYARCGGPLASFPSGHESSAFAGAGTSCAHHLHLPLYGGGAADVIPCIVELMAATGVGVNRLMGDNHWTTDVLLGGGIGFFYGYGLPVLAHYHPVLPTLETKRIHATLVPEATPSELGVRALGTF